MTLLPFMSTFWVKAPNPWRLTVVGDYVRQHMEISTWRLARQYFRFTRDWGKFYMVGLQHFYMETEGAGTSILAMATSWWMGAIRTRVNAYKCYIQISKFWGLMSAQLLGTKCPHTYSDLGLLVLYTRTSGYNLKTRALGTISRSLARTAWYNITAHALCPQCDTTS